MGICKSLGLLNALICILTIWESAFCLSPPWIPSRHRTVTDSYGHNILCLLKWQTLFFAHTRNKKVIVNKMGGFCICCCSVSQSCLTPCDSTDCSTTGFPVLHYLPEFPQIHVHFVSDAIHPSHPLSPPSLSAFNLSQHQGLFQWVGSSRQVAKVMELQL